MADEHSLTPERAQQLEHVLAVFGDRPDRLHTLAEFADNVAAGRRIMKIAAVVGGAALGLAAFGFYALGLWNGWHGAPMRRP